MKTFAHPRLPLSFQYPDPTPLGHPIRIEERSSPSGFRVHLTAPAADEIYFEIGRYTDLSAEDAIRQFLEDVQSRLEGLESSAVETTAFAGAPAHQFGIRWSGKERLILFIEQPEALYRIIHDPRSGLNRAILNSLHFLNVRSHKKR